VHHVWDVDERKLMGSCSRRSQRGCGCWGDVLVSLMSIFVGLSGLAVVSSSDWDQNCVRY